VLVFCCTVVAMHNVIRLCAHSCQALIGPDLVYFPRSQSARMLP
jgi:hypothetical protein